MALFTVFNRFPDDLLNMLEGMDFGNFGGPFGGGLLDMVGDRSQVSLMLLKI